MFAAHGFSIDIPSEWHPGIFRGDWETGHLVWVDPAGPRLNLSWRRGVKGFDFRRTVRSLEKAIRLDKPGINLEDRHEEEWSGPTGIFYSWMRGPEAAYAAILTPGDDLIIILRQMGPADPVRLRCVARSVKVAGPTDPIAWDFFGLRCSLPRGWILEGVTPLPGLVRGVWMHQSGRRKAEDQALVLRRYAMAQRIMEGADLTTWLKNNLAKADRIETAPDSRPDLPHLISTTPLNFLARMIRRKPQPVHWYAWLEPDEDRIVVQEWRSATEAVMGPLKP